MVVPRVVTAQFDRVPFIAPAGIKNAAGDTPVDGVAPGSIISIYGASIATRLEIGPSNPLAQSLAGVLVLLGDRLIPLIISPNQISSVTGRSDRRWIQLNHQSRRAAGHDGPV